MDASAFSPILIIGVGRMGGALIAGWRVAGSVALTDLMLRDPHPGAEALAAEAAGARLNMPDAELSRAQTVILAVKPQLWRGAAAAIAPYLATDAAIISIMAGVGAVDLSAALGQRPVARVMPTTAAAIRKGAFSVFAQREDLRERVRALFAPLGVVVDLADEGAMHVATGASGSAPAYLYAFIEALESAAEANGLSPDSARRLARSTITGAAALLDQSGEDPAELRRQVTSPGGTTQAALEVLMGDSGFPDLLTRAVAAAARRSRELGA
jgi:pyrroline-5-carboxylate reductase